MGGPFVASGSVAVVAAIAFVASVVTTSDFLFCSDFFFFPRRKLKNRRFGRVPLEESGTGGASVSTEEPLASASGGRETLSFVGWTGSDGCAGRWTMMCNHWGGVAVTENREEACSTK